jgi:hypothetical protein
LFGQVPFGEEEFEIGAEIEELFVLLSGDGFLDVVVFDGFEGLVAFVCFSDELFRQACNYIVRIWWFYLKMLLESTYSPLIRTLYRH